MGLLIRSLRLNVTSRDSIVFSDTPDISAIRRVGIFPAHILTVAISCKVGTVCSCFLQVEHCLADLHLMRVQEQRLYLDLSGVMAKAYKGQSRTVPIVFFPSQAQPDHMVLESGE
jgi:hypothetical protein